jgi:DNA replication protein DnaC
MRTEKEVVKDLKKLGEEYDILQNSDSENMWQYWEKERILREELEAIKEAKRQEEFNSPEAVAERKREWEEKQTRNIMNSGIGQRYLKADVHSFITETEEQKTALDTVKQFISNPWGKNLWLIGVAGTGKTLLGAIICRYCGARYIKSFQLKDELDYARNFNAKKNPTEVINDYANISVLVIDEVGRYKSPQEQEYIFRLLNERYEMKKPTVLISNMTKKEFGEYLGNPIVDRFRETCKSVEFTGESFRAKERNEWDGKINNSLFD